MHEPKRTVWLNASDTETSCKYGENKCLVGITEISIRWFKLDMYILLKQWDRELEVSFTWRAYLGEGRDRRRTCEIRTRRHTNPQTKITAISFGQFHCSRGWSLAIRGLFFINSVLQWVYMEQGKSYQSSFVIYILSRPACECERNVSALIDGDSVTILSNVSTFFATKSFRRQEQRRKQRTLTNVQNRSRKNNCVDVAFFGKFTDLHKTMETSLCSYLLSGIEMEGE